MANVEEVVQMTLEELRFVITKGLPAAQAERVVEVFRNEVLPFRMRAAVNDQGPETAARIEIVVEDIAKQFAGLTPDQKFATTEMLRLQAKLADISETAFSLARAKARGENIDKGVGAMALAKLKALRQEISASASETQGALADEASETTLDLMFALNAESAMSLRLHRALGSAVDPVVPSSPKPAAASAKRCGECGKVVDQHASHCPRCGSPLGPVSPTPTATQVEATQSKNAPGNGSEWNPQPQVDAGPKGTEPQRTQPGAATPPYVPPKTSPTACSNCGAQLSPGKKFCVRCGTPVR